MKTKYTVLLFALTILILKNINPPSIDFNKKQSNEVKLSENNYNISNPLNMDSTEPQTESIPKLFKFPEKGIPILMYHSIDTVPGNSLCVSEKQFDEEMRWLKSQDYHSLTIEEFYNAIAYNQPIPEKPILLTFDDGYEDNYKKAWPILYKYGFKATFFIITDKVGNNKMSWNQIEDLVHQGNSVGSHTVKHLDLTTLSAKQQEIELKESKQILENRLGIKINAFCFPSSRYNNTTIDLLKATNYTLSFSTKPGRVHLGDDIYTLRRIRIPAEMSLQAFKSIFN